MVPRLGLGFGSRLGLVLWLGRRGRATRQLPPIRVWVSFGVGGQFSAGAIVLEPGKITEKETPFILKFIEQYYFKIFEEFFLYRHFYNKQIFI